MPPRARILTHTPEQVVQWRKIAASNPGRLVRTLLLTPGETTWQGDTQGDIYPALQAVCDIIMEGHQSMESTSWVGLVNAGIADALCKNVCEMVMFVRVLPNMLKDLLEALKKEIPSPYYRPLEVLCHATICFHDPPTPTYRKVINTLRKNWVQMMERVWSEPENSLDKHDTYIKERMAIAQMAIKLVILDPPFISKIYDPLDLTIQIIARHWKHSTDALDSKLNCTVLAVLLSPDHPRHVAYVCSNNLEGSLPNVMHKIYTGVTPTNTTTKLKQAKALLAGFTEHLIRSNTNARLAVVELRFLLEVMTVASTDGFEPELARAVLGHTPLWNALFRLLKKCAKPLGVGEAGEEESSAKKILRMNVIQNIVGLAGNTLHQAMFANPRECEPFIRICVNEGFFGALEETIELIVEIKGMTMQVTRIGSILEGLLPTSTPSTIQLYCSQFPCWRILGVLFQHDLKRQIANGGGPPTVIPGSLGPPDSNVWDHGAWQVWGNVHYLCFDLEESCRRRGCGNTLEGNGQAQVLCKFKCQEARYCGETCRDK
ncbi:hypothetical protein DXG01_010034 [Tephrocybe rancida]|nr:hypothetical protein DXG01_010034 [Tephrocybe rancida]